MKLCEKYTELISAYVDGELSEAEVSELEAHLETCETCEVCEDCRRTLEFYRELSTIEQESMVEPPAGLHDSIMTAVKREKRRPFVRAIPALVGSLAACLVIAVGIGHFGGFGGSEETAGMDVMMYTRSMDMTAESEGVSVPAGGLTFATTGASEAASDNAPTYNGPIADVTYSVTGATTAAYDPNASVESPYADSSDGSAVVDAAKNSGATSASAAPDYIAPSNPQATPAPQGDNSAANDLPLEETAVEATTTDAPRTMMSSTRLKGAIVDDRIVIDPDAVTDFSYDNRMFELADAADATEMLKLLDYFTSLELTPLGEAPDVSNSAFSGVTAWLDDNSMLVFVYYPEGYVVEGENWYSFE